MFLKQAVCLKKEKGSLNWYLMKGKTKKILHMVRTITPEILKPS